MPSTEKPMNKNEHHLIATFIEESLNLYADKGKEITSELNLTLDRLETGSTELEKKIIGVLRKGLDDYLSTMDSKMNEAKTKAIVDLNSGGLIKTYDIVQPDSIRKEVVNDKDNPYRKAATEIRNEKTTWLRVADLLSNICPPFSEFCKKMDEENKQAAIGKMVNPDLIKILQDNKATKTEEPNSNQRATAVGHVKENSNSIV